MKYNQLRTPGLAWRLHGIAERMETGNKSHHARCQEQIHLYPLGVDVTRSKMGKIRPAWTYLRLVVMIK